MNETEVERLVVRLTGDGSAYQAMLQQAQGATEATASIIQAAAGKIEAFSDSIKGFASNALSALASFGAMGYLKSAFGIFEEREAGMIRMSAVLRSNGRDVEATTREYRSFAAELEQVSTSSVGATLALLRQAETFDLTGTAAERASRAAVGLAAVNEGEASSYIRMTAAMEKGDLRTAMRFARMIPQLRGIRDEHEFLTRYQSLVATGLETTAELAKTTGHQFERFGKIIKSFKGDLGAVVAEGLKPYVESLIEVAKWLKNLDQGSKQAIVVVLALVAAILLAPPAIAMAKYAFLTAFSWTGLFIAGIVAAGIAISQWIDSVGGVTNAWEIVKEVVQGALEWVGEFIFQNQEVFVTLGLVVGAIVAVYAAVRTVIFILGILHAVLTTLKVYQIAGIALWIAWKLVLLAVSVTVMLFNAQVAIWTFLLSAGAIGSGVVSAAMLIWKGVIWLVNAALTVMNILLAPAVILAAVGTLALVVVVFAAIGAAVYGVYSAINLVFQEISRLSTGPVGVITGMFQEWWSIIQLIVRAVRVDMNLAWRFMQAGFELAILQLRALWPPMWAFIQAGLADLWIVAVGEFRRAWVEAFNYLVDRAIRLGGIIALAMAGAPGLIIAIVRWNQQRAEDARLDVVRRSTLAEAQLRLQNLRLGAVNFDTPEIRAARERIRLLTGELEVAENRTTAARERGNDAAQQALETVQKTHKEMEKIENAAYASAEAFSRLASYRDKFMTPTAVANSVNVTAALATPTGNTTANTQNVRDNRVVEQLIVTNRILSAIASAQGIPVGAADLAA